MRGTTQLLPILDPSRKDISDLIQGEVVNRVPRVDNDGNGVLGNRHGVDIFLVREKGTRGHPDVCSTGSDCHDPGGGSAPLDIDMGLRVVTHIFLCQQFGERFNRSGARYRDPGRRPLTTDMEWNNEKD